MEFKMSDLWGMVQVIGIPLFLWMERRTTKAQSDAQWARSVAEQTNAMARDTKAQLEIFKGEQTVITNQLFAKIESVSVTLARIEGRLESVFGAKNG